MQEERPETGSSTTEGATTASDYYTEADWKLFRSRVPEWQESYMEKLNREYVELLTGDGLPSEKFWALCRRVNKDKRTAGVSVEMRRSALIDNMAALYRLGAIDDDDLEGFSDELKEAVLSTSRLWRQGKGRGEGGRREG